MMNEIRKMSGTVLPMLKTEAYYPTKYPELKTKCWHVGVKKIEVSAQWTDVQILHVRFGGKNRFPIKKPKGKLIKPDHWGLESHESHFKDKLNLNCISNPQNQKEEKNFKKNCLIFATEENSIALRNYSNDISNKAKIYLKA